MERESKVEESTSNLVLINGLPEDLDVPKSNNLVNIIII